MANQLRLFYTSIMGIRSFFKVIPILSLTLGVVLTCFSQDKIEKETRIKTLDVPSNAKKWLQDSFEKIKRPKWFLEYSQNGKSFEAKFKYQNHFHSVEFDSLGHVEDVEIEIFYSEIPGETWEVIQSYYKSEFELVKVEKIQRQFSGAKSDLEDFFDEEEQDGVTIRYEIVFQGKNKTWSLWEALFDESGKFISKLEVQIRPNDNLIF